jgi:hypothetical protein
MKYIKNRKALSEHGKIMDGEDALIHTARTIANETNDEVIARTTVGWTGDVDTIWRIGLDSEQMVLHQRTLDS